MTIAMDFLNESLSSIAGPNNVISDVESLEKYSCDKSFVKAKRPLFTVLPENTGEVKEIVTLANRHNIPVTPYSAGANNQGAAIPAAGGILVDLSKMNRIIEIDEKNRNAVIEPGVTFAQLQQEAHKYNLRVLTPIETPASASVLTNYLELSPLYSWFKYGLETLLTIELVLGNGETLRTGNASNAVSQKPYDPLPNAYVILNKIWFGSQGTLGIATKGAITLKKKHDVNKVFFGESDNLEGILAPLRTIQKNRVGEEIFIVNRSDLSLLMAENSDQIKDFRSVLKQWNLVVLIRGYEDEVQYQKEDLDDIGRDFDITFKESAGSIKNSCDLILQEIEKPSGWIKTSKYEGARNTIPFIAKIEQIAQFNELAYATAKKFNYPLDDIGCLMIPAEVGRVHYQFSFARNHDDDQESEKVREMFLELSELLIRKGAFFSRPFGDWAELVYGRTPSYYTMLKEFKNMIDPNNIMNPNRIFVL